MTIVENLTSKILLVGIAILLVASCVVSASPEPVTVNPYNPLLQPGSYTNYHINHPNALPIPKEIAEDEYNLYMKCGGV